MRYSSTIVCLVVAMLVVGLSGCHSTGAWNSRHWTASSFNPTTWRMGINAQPSSLAAAPPAKPSLTATPIYPNTSAPSSLASATTPPTVEYPATAASFNAPGSAAKGPLGTMQSPRSPLAAKSPLMSPQQGRYGAANSPASNPVGGFKNPAYNIPANSAPYQKTPLVQNPYRVSVPAIPPSSGSLATAAGRTPVQPNCVVPSSASPNSTSTDSRYRAAIASSTSRPSYNNDPNSRHYGSPAVQAMTPATAPAAPNSPAMPKVAGDYPSTSVGSPVATTAIAPSGRRSAIPSPVNVTVPANSKLPDPSYPVTTPVATTPVTTAPAASAYQPGANGYQPGANGYQPGANGYQPGANGYQPGANQYTPGDTGYQIPATRYSAPIQSNSQPVGNNFGFNTPAAKTPAMAPLAPAARTTAPAFRPGSTGSVEGYPSTQAVPPVRTSINTSNVMPVGFNQTQPLRR